METMLIQTHSFALPNEFHKLENNLTTHPKKAVMSIKIADLTSPEVIELTDLEIKQIIGGASDSSSISNADFSAQLGALKAMFAEAQQKNIEMRMLTTEEGTELKAAGKDVNPK